MTEDGNTLGVGFEIDFLDSFGKLKSLDALIGEAAANATREFKQIQQSIDNAVPGTALAKIRAYGIGLDEATVELRKLKAETKSAERSGEDMVRQLQRQVDVFGKTSSEIRNFRAEQRAATAESRGLTELAGRIRDLNGELNRLEAASPKIGAGIGTIGNTGRLAGHHMQNLAFQFQDLGVQMFAAAGSSDPLKLGLTALVQQGSQIGGIMSQAGIGVRGVGAAFLTMSSNILVAVATNPILLGLTATIGLFAGAVSLLNDAASESAGVEEYAKSLGLTKDEIEELGGATVTWGDTAKAVFQVVGAAIWDNVGPAVLTVWNTMKEWASWIYSGVRASVNFLIGGFVGAYNAITKTWSLFPAALGDVFYNAVNFGITAINGLISASVGGINSFISKANGLLAAAGSTFKLPTLTPPQIDTLSNNYAGAFAKAGKAGQAELAKAFSTDYVGKSGKAVDDQAQINAQNRLRAAADEKGFLDDDGKSDKAKKDKAAASDKHAESLAREAAAVAAQIKNLYALADAYGVSGDAALIAEARLKAESDAIKDRANIEQRFIEQIQLAIAQRVSDAAKATASLRDQAAAQAFANSMVEQGLLAADQAADHVKDQIADLPLVAALQAAQQKGLVIEAERATQALDAQREARDRLRAAEEAAALNKEIAGGDKQIATLTEELRLVGATNAQRSIALTLLKATQEAEEKFNDPAARARYIEQQVAIAKLTTDLALAQRAFNDELNATANKWGEIAGNVQNAAQGIADAFGNAGAALGGLASTYANFQADRARLDAAHQAALKEFEGSPEATARAEQRFAKESADLQISLYGDLAASAKGFFDEKSKGYQAILAAEKVFRAFEFAMSVRSMVQDVAETISSVANSGARATAAGAEGVAKQAKLPFPANIAAMAATAAALVAAGIAVFGGGGGGSTAPESNTGTGTVLGDGGAQSESIKNAISALRDVDLLMLNTSRQMAASLRTIETNIGGFASLLVRQGDSINASGGVAEGFKANGIGSILGNIPVIGGLLKGLFGTTTTVQASGLFGGPQSLDSILDGGFDASYFSDIQRKKKFFGITTSNRTSTQFSAADSNLENQFTLILREFNSAILAAAGPLGVATSEIEQRLSGFVVDIGRINLQGLSGEEIEERLNAVFGATADNLARAAFPLIDQFQRVGEGAFETLVRVTSTVEAVTSSLTSLGSSARNLGIEVKLGLADQFESISALTNAVDAYFQAYYTEEEQAASRTAQISSVFASLGLTLPSTLAGFRQLVEAQDLTSASGLETYATLLKLAPAFADLQEALNGAKSAADIASEKTDLQRQLLELQGDTAAIRALQLARLDESNRALQEQIYAIQDAREAARAAEELREAWTSVGDSILDEINRIRGIADATGGTSFATLSGQFNEATLAARAGDQDAARRLPQLSQALLTAAAEAATSRQELDRIQAQTAASLEASYRVISLFGENATGLSSADLLDAAQSGSPATAANNDNARESLAGRFEELRQELRQLRTEHMAALAAIAGNTGSIKRTMDNVTQESGGTAISTTAAAA